VDVTVGVTVGVTDTDAVRVGVIVGVTVAVGVLDTPGVLDGDGTGLATGGHAPKVRSQVVAVNTLQVGAVARILA
jgi:hypothetical protein